MMKRTRRRGWLLGSLKRLRLVLAVKRIALLFTIMTLSASVAAAANAASVKTQRFKDVAEDHWAKAAIDLMSAQGYMGGYPDGKFRPSGSISRAEFTAVLYRITGLPSKQSSMFPDIADHWATDAIQSATAEGIIAKSDFGTKFQPNKSITRLEMARMMARALARTEGYDAYLEAYDGLYNGDLPFVDYREIKDADLPLLGLVYGARVMSGYPDASFGMDKNATRAEASVMYVNLLSAMEKAPEDYQYLRELKEIAETGMNAAAVSNMEPRRNLVTEETVVEHKNFTAKLKRLYVVPMTSDVVSMYERKFLWDRNEMEERFRKGMDGYVVGVLDITLKVDGERWVFSNHIYLSPSAAFSHQTPSQKYEYFFPWKDEIAEFKKGETYEVVIYGIYNTNYWAVNLQTNYATKGSSYELLFNTDKKQG